MRPIRTTLGASPKPKKSMMIGRKATLGRGWRR